MYRILFLLLNCVLLVLLCSCTPNALLSQSAIERSESGSVEQPYGGTEQGISLDEGTSDEDEPTPEPKQEPAAEEDNLKTYLEHNEKIGYFTDAAQTGDVQKVALGERFLDWTLEDIDPIHVFKGLNGAVEMTGTALFVGDYTVTGTVVFKTDTLFGLNFYFIPDDQSIFPRWAYSDGQLCRDIFPPLMMYLEGEDSSYGGKASEPLLPLFGEPEEGSVFQCELMVSGYEPIWFPSAFQDRLRVKEVLSYELLST